MIDSWGGSGGNSFAPGIFNVKVDGNSSFSESFNSFVGPASFVLESGVLLASDSSLGFNFHDAFAYDLEQQSAFNNISHSSNTLSFEFFASGTGLQGGTDESWVIDNLRVVWQYDDSNPGPRFRHLTGAARILLRGFVSCS